MEPMQLDLFITQSESAYLKEEMRNNKESIRKTQKGLFARLSTLLGMVCKNEDNIVRLRKRVEDQEAIIRDLNYRLSDIERTYTADYLRCVN